jgi:hypothetical protein
MVILLGYSLSKNDAGREAELCRQRLPVDGAQLLDAEVVVKARSAECVSARDVQRCHERLQANVACEILVNFLDIVVHVRLVGGMTLAADSARSSAAAAAPAAAPSLSSNSGITPRMLAFLHCGITSHTYLIPPAIQKEGYKWTHLHSATIFPNLTQLSLSVP